MASDDGGVEWTCAIQGHVHEVEAECQTKLFAHEMRLCPNPSGSVVVFSGVGFDEGDEVLDARCRHRRVDYESGGCHHCKRYWREVLLRVVRYFSVGVRVHDKGAKRKEYGITVGCGPRRLAHANIAAGPSDVLDIELLPERFAEFLSGNPREDIGASAGREWHNHAHRPRRIALRPSKVRHSRQRGSARGQMQKLSAGKFHFEPSSLFTSHAEGLDRHVESTQNTRNGPRYRFAVASNPLVGVRSS